LIAERRGDGVDDEDDELAMLFAAWREELDSVPVSAMPVLEAALILHTDSPIQPATRLSAAIGW
jgi:hypothetical protein